MVQEGGGCGGLRGVQYTGSEKRGCGWTDEIKEVKAVHVRWERMTRVSETEGRERCIIFAYGGEEMR